MFRPDLKQPKNAAGAILIIIAVLAAFIAHEYTLSFAVYYVAAALYVVGMILIVIPGRMPPNADQEAEPHEPEAGDKNTPGSCA